MKLNFFSNPKITEALKLTVIIFLFASMLWLFVQFTEIKMGSLEMNGVSSLESFPADKKWVFSGNANRASAYESLSPYIIPTSITFRNNSVTSAVLKQKSTLVTIYKDIVQYISEVLGPQYTAETVDYASYQELIKNGNYTILSYDSDISAYMLRLYCDRNANGFYNGQPCNIRKLLLTEDANARLVAYAVSSENSIVRFAPISDTNAGAYPINSAIISAYTNSKFLSDSFMSFESEFFSSQSNFASDITFLPDMQFYEAGISNPLSFITELAAQESLIKNDKILSILKCFKINTGLVRHYTDDNVLYFVESNALLEMSSDGYITYTGENGGIHLSKLLGEETEEFSVSDKITAAAALIGEFGNDIIGGNGEIILSSISYDTQREAMKFEFTYTFDTVPFYGLDKIEIEIGDSSVLKAHIPTYSIFRNSVRKIMLIPPEVAYSATPVSWEDFVCDYKTGYIVDKNGLTANVGWIAVV